MFAFAWLALGLAAHAALPANALPANKTPANTTIPPAAGASATIVYVVRRDETLLEIAHRALEPVSSYREVQQLNHIANDRRIPIGFHLIVPRALLKTRPILATVEGVRGAAQAEGGGATGALAVGRTLTEGAVILTGENAYVRLGLPDGSHLAIPSNSKVALERLRAVVLTGGIDREIRVQAGGLDSQVTPMTDPSSRFVVVTPVAQSAVRGTEFQVAYDPGASRATSGVLKGVVGVSNPRAEAVARAGQGVVATPGGLKGPVSLLPAPELEPESAVQGGERLRFAIKPVAGAARYRLVIAGDPRVEAPLYELTIDRPATEVPGLPDGAYYVKLSAISRDGLEGLPGIAPFTRVRGDLTIVGAVRGADGQTEFRWASPGETPAVYRFVLARRQDRDHPVVARDDLAEPRIVVPALAAGDYVWTVFAFRTVGGRRLEIASDPQSLHVP